MAETTITDEFLTRAEQRADAAMPDGIGWKPGDGPYNLDVWAASDKGGYRKLADIRGWGYFTGLGHGALGISVDEAYARQSALTAHIAGLSPPVIKAWIARTRADADTIAAQAQRIVALEERIMALEGR